MTGAALPAPARLLALAHAALVDQLGCDDPAHARRRLLVDLSHALGLQVTLLAITTPSPQVLGDGALALPLRHLGHDLGTLSLQPGHGLLPADTAQALACITRTLAALLLRERSSAGTDGPVDTAAPAATPPARAGGSAGPLLRAALRGAGTYVWEWDIPSDRLGDFDEGFEQLGYAPRPGRVTQQDWDALIHPDDRAGNHEAYLRHARGDCDYYEHAYRARAADGHWRWMQERGRIVDWAGDGTPQRMVGTQVDITERRRAEAQVQQATERLGKIAGHVPGALFQYQRQADGSARFPYISERCTALLGVTPEDLARDAAALLRRVDPAAREAVLRSIVQSAATLQPWRCEFDLRGRDGVTLTVRGAATPQRQADGSVLWHGYFDDVTEANALAQAEHHKRLAEAANRTKTEFLSRMSHELRTPLNAVLGFAQLLAIDQGSLQAAEPQRRLGLIRQSGEHLLAMIDDLLDLTSIEAGRLPLTLESVPLAPLVDDTLALVQVAMGRPDLQLQREGATGLAAWADRKRLRQVLINLLSNAVKYNRAGGSVRVVLAAAGHEVRLAVHDTGAGLSAADLAQLFEPFNRLGQAHGPIEGTGIGLTVTRGLVQLMGGAITVQSTPGVGSCFAVALPAAPAPYNDSLP